MGKGIGVSNTGVAFGLGKGWGSTIAGLVVLVLIFHFRWKVLDNFGLALILAGGSANFVFRVMNGFVWDYCHLFILWVNGGDWLIFTGTVIYLFQLYEHRDSLGK